MEILRAVVSRDADVVVEINGNMFEVLAATVTAIQGVHEAYRRENPVKAALFRAMLTDYLTEEAEDAFAPVGNEDLGHYADLTLLGKIARRMRKGNNNTSKKEEPNGNEDHCEP